METSDTDTSITSRPSSLPQIQFFGVNTAPSSGGEALADVLGLQSRPRETAATSSVEAKRIHGDGKASLPESACMVKRPSNADSYMRIAGSPRGDFVSQCAEQWNHFERLLTRAYQC
jgi:hypothetical protein